MVAVPAPASRNADTVCGVSRLDDVKVNRDGLPVTSPSLRPKHIGTLSPTQTAQRFSPGLLPAALRCDGTLSNREPARLPNIGEFFDFDGVFDGVSGTEGEAARGANRRALRAATNGHPIYDVWSDEPWVIDGVAVRVSLVCFACADDQHTPGIRLDGQPAGEIYPDLTARRGGTGIDLTQARRLSANRGAAFMGDTKSGPFDIPGDLARGWMQLPANPYGRSNADVLKPWINRMDLTRRPAGKGIVDFGWEMSQEEAALYEVHFAYVAKSVRPERRKNRVGKLRDLWSRHERPRPERWRRISKLSRHIATPRVAKHRLFVWLDSRICPDSAVIALARDDDASGRWRAPVVVIPKAKRLDGYAPIDAIVVFEPLAIRLR